MNAKPPRGDAVGTCGKEGGGGECAWPRGGRVDGNIRGGAPRLGHVACGVVLMSPSFFFLLFPFV